MVTAIPLCIPHSICRICASIFVARRTSKAKYVYKAEQLLGLHFLTEYILRAPVILMGCKPRMIGSFGFGPVFARYPDVSIIFDFYCLRLFSRLLAALFLGDRGVGGGGMLMHIDDWGIDNCYLRS